MNEELEVFEGYDSVDTARFVILDLLEENDIPYAIYKDTYRQEVILGSSMDMVSVWVKIRRSDFVKVNQLMLKAAKERSEEIPQDHYLLEMDAKELLQIVKNRDEWGIADMVTAQKLLTQQGITITDEQIDKWYAQKLDQIEQQKRKELNQLSAPIPTHLINRATHIQESSVLNKQTGERKYVFSEAERKGSYTTYFIGLIILLAFFILLIMRSQSFQGGIF